MKPTLSDALRFWPQTQYIPCDKIDEVDPEMISNSEGDWDDFDKIEEDKGRFVIKTFYMTDISWVRAKFIYETFGIYFLWSQELQRIFLASPTLEQWDDYKVDCYDKRVAQEHGWEYTERPVYNAAYAPEEEEY